MASTDWDAWHDDYADPTSPLAQRLQVVQRAIEGHLDSSAPRDVRVVSACAGDGRDLLQVLERRDDADRVSATLIEADPDRHFRPAYFGDGWLGIRLDIGDTDWDGIADWLRKSWLAVASPTSVVRALAALRARGVITTARCSIVITDMAGLRGFTH